MNRPRFLAIDDSMMRRLRVLTIFVGVIWLAFGVIRILQVGELGLPILAVVGIVLGIGFLTLALLLHLELRFRARS